jgi:predicted kinase
VAAIHIVARWLGLASKLKNVEHLRKQAVFLMGAGGSGKGFVGERWLKYMPGGPDVEEDQPSLEDFRNHLDFAKAVDTLQTNGYRIEAVSGGARIPFALYRYGPDKEKVFIPPEEWQQRLPPKILSQVREVKEILFSAPREERPSYWRQTDPDMFKKQIPGYEEKDPGYVHEMSSVMSKAYLAAVLESGDPIIVDGTGKDPADMMIKFSQAKNAGYRIALVYVKVPLTVNQIRNAVRSRNVHPDTVTKQWFAIEESFSKLKSAADRWKVIDNRNDPVDKSNYLKNSEKINEFIARTTSYDNLYNYIAAVRPGELSDWGKILQSDVDPDAERKERYERLEQKRREKGMESRPFIARQPT